MNDSRTLRRLEHVLRTHSRLEEPLLRKLRPLHFFEEFLVRATARARFAASSALTETKRMVTCPFF
jgi:hypothetical protein